jgi:hypothetical protein
MPTSVAILQAEMIFFIKIMAENDGNEWALGAS